MGPILSTDNTPFKLGCWVNHTGPVGQDKVSQRVKHQLRCMQPGLVYPAPYARFALFWLKDSTTMSKAVFSGVVQQISTEIRRSMKLPNTTTAVFGVSFDLLKKWGGSLPKGAEIKFPNDGTSSVFSRSRGVYQDSGADVFVHIKSEDPANCPPIYDAIRRALDPYGVENEQFQDCDSRNERGGKEGRVLGCRFAENLNNPADPITIANHTVIGYDDTEHLGGSFVLAQRFVINWELVHNLPEERIEDLIGRTTDNVIIPGENTRSHLRCGRFRDENGNTKFIMRLGLPFGSAVSDSLELLYKGSNLRDEEGIFFAGFSNAVGHLESIMDQQIGDVPGYMKDKLFDNIASSVGGFFYIPSLVDLGIPGPDWTDERICNWSKFPGVDWSRLSRHFEDKSDNGVMFYNSKNFLYEMATMPANKERIYDPPSGRILTLLLDAFTVWQDTWYFRKRQAEMGHLRDYITADFGAAKAKEVMASSIMIRKGWATRMQCRLYASDEYGFRGSRTLEDGSIIHGADSYRIHPLEIIVGAQVDLSLAQGRYCMQYLRDDDERKEAFFKTLSEASGVGHVIPDFKRVLDRGIGGTIDMINEMKTAATKKKKKEFYEACVISLVGVQDFLDSYAALADKMVGKVTDDQKMEKDNLQAIAERLRRLKTDKPATMLEATQLVFTLYTTLGYNGEPCAIGRLDQILFPFYQADKAAGKLTDDDAQEIIDAFWIKVDEKVLQNRNFIADHQPPGVLAMGGMSAPYPQGASLGQWIQQVTVGGYVANDDPEPTLAYNTLSKLCLRAAGRLPLQAPCLSLRVNKNTPAEFFEEAAKCILSGGAHPVLCNDEKIVAGIQGWGKDIGMGREHANQYTPVKEKVSGGKWDSTVSLKDARNYGCDGCFEPLSTGNSWFTLCGFSATDPLECALNQGRTFSLAGPDFLSGTNASLRSKPVEEIDSFQDLLEIYFKHLETMWATQFNGSLYSFDANASFCPSPLLSIMTDDCLQLGLDIYEGGARHNVFGPCFTAPSTAINSLYNINKMVFQKDTAVTSLPELTRCLMCDWGNKMVEPMVSSMIGPTRTVAKAERYKRLREIALSYEKYGRGVGPSTDPDYDPNDPGTFSVDQLGDYVNKRIADVTVKVLTDPRESTAAQMVAYGEKYGSPDAPFGFHIAPGTGTFENFVAFGGSVAASADGRHNGEWISSDSSASPAGPDTTDKLQLATFSKALASGAGEGNAAMWMGAATDFNIPEDFPIKELANIVKQFADGNGSNIITITTANNETLRDAMGRPERYDLLRVRMGGWSEFFTSMFTASQEQQVRRPISTPAPPKNQESWIESVEDAFKSKLASRRDEKYHAGLLERQAPRQAEAQARGQAGLVTGREKATRTSKRTH